jgi:hypothetical protein
MAFSQKFPLPSGCVKSYSVRDGGQQIKAEGRMNKEEVRNPIKEEVRMQNEELGAMLDTYLSSKSEVRSPKSGLNNKGAK